VEKIRNRIIVILFIAATILLWSGSVSWSARAVTVIGGPENNEPGKTLTIPTLVKLPMPGSVGEKTYLGLSGSADFKIATIKAPILIIEIFSFYCPHCQMMASKVNELYQKIQANPDTRDKIKMIGIGVNNSKYEIDAFREKYGVPFPLVPDLSTDISIALGARGTPTFIGLNVNDTVSQRPFYFGEGGFEDVELFLSEITKLSGLK
jgi:thiol-disulfide isomerase/thioredoxin